MYKKGANRAEKVSKFSDWCSSTKCLNSPPSLHLIVCQTNTFFIVLPLHGSPCCAAPRVTVSNCFIKRRGGRCALWDNTDLCVGIALPSVLLLCSSENEAARTSPGFTFHMGNPPSVPAALSYL